MSKPWKGSKKTTCGCKVSNIKSRQIAWIKSSLMFKVLLTGHLLEHPFLRGDSMPPSYSKNDESIIPGGKRKKREQA